MSSKPGQATASCWPTFARRPLNIAGGACSSPRSLGARPAKLLPPLKAIWLAGLQPCALRRHAGLPDWLPDYEADHRRLDPDGRQALLSASPATLNQLLNCCLPTLKLEGKQRVGSKVVRRYRPVQTPLARVLARAEVSEATKARLRAERAGLNPFALRREVDRRLQSGPGTPSQPSTQASPSGMPGPSLFGNTVSL